jgi:hypothetical protein
MKRIRSGIRALKHGLIWTLLAPPRSVRWMYRKTMVAIRYIGAQIKRFILAVLRSPRATYNKIVSARNWLLAKVEYLQSESQRWRTTFSIAKLPYTFLTKLGFSPMQAGSFLIAGSVATTGVVTAEVLEGRSFSAGDSGVYTAPSDTPIEWSDSDNTLRIDLGSTPVGEIIIEDVTVGTAYANSALPSGETNPVLLAGTIASEGFTATDIQIGHLIIDRWRCTQLLVTNVEAHTLNIKYNAADGQSIAPTPSTPRAIGIGGGNRAKSMITSGGYYDQIKITAPTSATDGKVDKMILRNLYTKGGACKIDRLKVGTLDIIYNEVGAGDGFATKDLQIANTVTYSVFTNTDNIELSISPPS